jgi:HK97 family phage major capsid protein
VAYNNIISRSDVQSLIPERVSTEILNNLKNESAALTLFKRVPMSTNTTRMPVLAALPTAYFVNGDTGLKQSTEVNWSNKFLNVEELAAIIPIPEAVLDDTAFDVWGAIRPLIENAIGRALDAAIFLGSNKPASWPSDILTAAVAAGNTVTRGSNLAATGSLAGDISDLFTTVEADGYDVSGVISNVAYKGKLRQARTTQGEQLEEVNSTTAYGVPVMYPMRGLWPSGSGAVEAFAGDFTQGLLGTRQDFTYKILDQAVLTDNTGAIVYNFAQQDMVALRVVFRVAFQIANTINYDQAVDANRYPFAVLKAP